MKINKFLDCKYMLDSKILERNLNELVADFQFSDNIRGKRFLITGATGFIGSYIVRFLLKLNEIKDLNVVIYAIVRDLNKVKGIFGGKSSAINWIEVDISEPFEVNDKVDYIIHCASPTSSKFLLEHPVEVIQTNVNSTSKLLEYARKEKIKGMVYLSSLEVYGENRDEREIKEEEKLNLNSINTRSSYPISKSLCECLCHSYAKEYGVRVNIARLTQTVGAGAPIYDNRAFMQFTRLGAQGENIEIHTDGSSSKPYCYISDAVNAIFFLLIRGKSGEAYNIANPHSYISIRDLASYICSKDNVTSRFIHKPKSNMGYAPITSLNLNVDKLMNLGWMPKYDLSRMVDHSIKYYNELIPNKNEI